MPETRTKELLGSPKGKRNQLTQLNRIRVVKLNNPHGGGVLSTNN